MDLIYGCVIELIFLMFIRWVLCCINNIKNWLIWKLNFIVFFVNMMGDNWFVCKLNVINGEWILLKMYLFIYMYFNYFIIWFFNFWISLKYSLIK